MGKQKVNIKIVVTGGKYTAGDTVKIPEDVARKLIKSGRAVPEGKQVRV